MNCTIGASTPAVEKSVFSTAAEIFAPAAATLRALTTGAAGAGAGLPPGTVDFARSPAGAAADELVGMVTMTGAALGELSSSLARTMVRTPYTTTPSAASTIPTRPIVPANGLTFEGVYRHTPTLVISDTLPPEISVTS